MWDMPSGVCVPTMNKHSEAVWGLALSRSGDALLSCSKDHTVRVWGNLTGEPPTRKAVLSGHTGPVRSAAFAQRTGIVATASYDGSIRTWDLSTVEEPLVLLTIPDAHSEWVHGPN